MDLTKTQQFYYDQIIRLANLMSEDDQIFLDDLIANLDNLILSLQV